MNKIDVLENSWKIEDGSEFAEVVQWELEGVENQIFSLLEETEEDNDKSSENKLLGKNEIAQIAEKATQVIVDKFNEWNDVTSLLKILVVSEGDSSYLKDVKCKIQEYIINYFDYDLIKLLIETLGTNIYDISSVVKANCIVKYEDISLIKMIIDVFWDDLEESQIYDIIFNMRISYDNVEKNEVSQILIENYKDKLSRDLAKEILTFSNSLTTKLLNVTLGDELITELKMEIQEESEA